MAALAGCLVIPTPELSEFRSSRLDFIEPGVTTRSDVESRLLSEDVFEAFVSGPYTVYAEYRRAPFSIITEHSSGLMGDVDDYLVVEYDSSQRVARFDNIRREGGCTSYGLCVRGGEPRNNGLVIVYASDDMDANAKTFTSPSGACSVYVAVDGGLPCNSAAAGVAVARSGERSAPPSRVRVDGYLLWEFPVRPGSTGSETLLATRRGETLAAHEFSCGDGEISVFMLELESCAIGKPRATFLPLSKQEGAEALDNRRLLLR